MKTLFRVIWKIVGFIAYTTAVAAVCYAVIFSLAATIALAWLGWHIYLPVKQVKALARSNPSESAFMESLRHRIGLPSDSALNHKFVPFDSISPHLVKAVIAAEDDAFWVHPGFDVNAIAAAFQRNRMKDKVEFGGSTITQQVAKNFFLSAERSFVRKVQELGYAILMEKYLGKKRIMELYLNYAQWGKTIFGCEAAARTFFNKSSKNLSMKEASLLAAMLPKPCTTNPHATQSSFLGKRLSVIADNLYAKGIINDSMYITISGRKPKPKDSLQVGASEQNHISGDPQTDMAGKQKTVVHNDSLIR